MNHGEDTVAWGSIYLIPPALSACLSVATTILALVTLGLWSAKRHDAATTVRRRAGWCLCFASLFVLCSPGPLVTTLFLTR